ncbi:MAG: S-formylglutathione hydrolase [Phenylobacterium sp. RIFCSPHIGHO2_01_FULL_69_31]|uniref:S-formylglutathione hydrolase n=1 Tax=Phenylobacterium sp. RIFCSPHIGHO2_01_FULL_69_31 TaxID=1801944 RepID=UPI0008BAD0D5|nr:S-formylglutathione hydrolase [Phenylobacterium sp. RIFCSPHIGHO2_01_FULL_69_31]OHB28013.1 MAG: S-formylglutathione hydrolase [Phenylobacterium sp. RIFCSPHIGHO2_01_FULL_69_31]
MENVQQHRTHGGLLTYARHDSAATGTPMRASVFTPPGDGPFPVLYWLSGLTCTEDNFTTKAGAYAAAAAHGVMIVAPDTSPRGEGVADDPAYDLGQGAGFYLDAIQAPWAPHFRMETYVTQDLVATVEDAFPADAARRGIFGHSMGGHGALTLALKHPDLYRSVSAFAPIVSPTRCDWGRKAFAAYLGGDAAGWAAHDACRLVEAGAARGRFDDILIDQGGADSFLETQLKPDLFEAACGAAGQKLTLRMQAGYDHSYFFIASFVADHVAWHAERLRS